MDGRSIRERKKKKVRQDTSRISDLEGYLDKQLVMFLNGLELL